MYIVDFNFRIVYCFCICLILILDLRVFFFYIYKCSFVFEVKCVDLLNTIPILPLCIWNLRGPVSIC